MTLTLDVAQREYDYLQALNKAFFVPQDVARVLGVSSYAINLQAHEDATKLGFPVIVSGRRVRIPRAAFLSYISGTVLGNAS